MFDQIFVRIHAMPCVNRCWHCFCEGSPEGSFMEGEACLRILAELAELKRETGKMVFPLFFDEPTLHPAFEAIITRQLDLGLIHDNWWFSTNGYGLARLSDTRWRRLADAGFKWPRLHFHGLESQHDRLAGRKGAWKDLVTTIEKCEKYDIPWLAGMMLNRENQSSYEEVKETVTGLGEKGDEFGWMLPMSQGRAADPASRVRKTDIERLLAGTHGWVAEGEFIDKVLADETLAGRTNGDHRCGIMKLDVEKNMNVYFGGGCDGDPFWFMKERMLLGNLDTHGLSECYRRYTEDVPEPVTVLEKVTWRELAEKYGDTESDLVYHSSDLTGRKWAEACLRDRYDIR